MPGTSTAAARAVVTIVLLALTACGQSAGGTESGGAAPTGSPPSPSSTDPQPDAATATGPTSWRYVALGDSFTAAPRNPTTDATDVCMQSDMNYPHLAARGLGVRQLVDVSCGGATIEDLYRPQTVRAQTRPPQLDAVTADTDLVTISLGLNEAGLYGRLMFGCTKEHRTAPEKICPVVSAADRTSRQIRTIRDKLVRAVDAVQAKAPRARVVLLGYPTILNPDVVCPVRLPLRNIDVPIAAVLLDEVSAQVGDAAKDAGVTFVDRARASVGHGICSDDPWMNGAGDDPSLASAFHPFPEEQASTARALESALQG